MKHKLNLLLTKFSLRNSLIIKISKHNFSNFYKYQSMNRSNSLKSSILDNKVYDRTFPFHSFYLSTQEAYWVNEHDRNLLLLKSNNVNESEKKRFFIDMMTELVHVKKLFPYLKGTKNIANFLIDNIFDFNKNELNVCISRLETLKIFDSNFAVYENENDSELMTLNFDFEIKKENEILNNNLINNIIIHWTKLNLNLKKNEKISFEASLNILEYLSLVECIENKKFIVDLYNYIDLDNMNFSQKTRLLYLTMKIDSKFVMNNITNNNKNSNENISFLKLINEILNTIVNDKTGLNSYIYEIAQFIEIVGKLFVFSSSNDVLIEFIYNKLLDKLIKSYDESYVFNLNQENLITDTLNNGKSISNSKLNSSENKKTNFKNNSYHFVILYKLLDIDIHSLRNNKSSISIHQDLIFLILNSIDYKVLNQMEKIYFHQIIAYLDNSKIKSSKSSKTDQTKLKFDEEFSTLLSKYKLELSIQDNEKIDIDFFEYLQNFEMVKDYRNKIYYNIDYFSKNSKKLALEKINVCNAILTYS